MSLPVYLDNNATTCLDDRVLAAMLPVLRHTGNASSDHEAGRWARERVEAAREQVAFLLHARRQEVVFTSGATEANNLAIKGLASGGSRRRRIVSCTTEHAAVLGPLEQLSHSGFDVHLVPVDHQGRLDLDKLDTVVTEETLVVTVMTANNETGVLAPLAEITELAHERGALVHTDATQALAWGLLDVEQLPVDLASLSGHKFHGPQGVGALFVRRDVQSRMRPVSGGGGHERGLRSGTLNTAGIAGLGAAAELVSAEGGAAAERVATRRDTLFGLILQQAGRIELNGSPSHRAPGTLNIAVDGVASDVLLATTPSVAMSSGSACSTGVPGPSHVLTAMHMTPERADSSIRLSLSRFTTDDDVIQAARDLSKSIRRARERSSLVGAR
jgi:cysteine desulfurase